MKRPPPSSIPPLTDSALHRIERGVFAALDAPAPLSSPPPATPWRRGFVGISLAAAAAAIVAVGMGEGRRGEPTRTAQLTTTTSGSRLAIAGAALEIAPESAVSVGPGKDGATIVVLDRGTVTCEVAPRTSRAPFIVEAGATRVTVIGTRFTVRRLGAHASVSVEHGLVEVADTDMTELVRAGERFVPGEPVAREPVASSAPTEASSVAAASPGAARVAAKAPVPEAAKAPAPDAAKAPALVAQTGTAPTHRAHERHLASAADRVAVVAPPLPAVGDEARADAPTETPPVVEKASEAPAPAGAQRGSSQVLFELAAQLEVRDPTTALSIYGQIAAGDDAWAGSALFASARLEAERSHARAAHELAAAYLQRFPRGPNADDARALLDALR